MRRGTKEIRKVFTGSKEYYIYDLDKDFFGKTKRLYADSEGELKEKIAAAEAERKVILETYRPVGKKLSDYVCFYFKCSISKSAMVDIKRLTVLFENAVFGSKIDKNIDEITEEEMQEFYNGAVLKFQEDSIKEITKVLEKSFVLAKQSGVETQFDLSKIKKSVPDARTVQSPYIMTPKEYELMLSYCISDDCTRYGVNELALIFLMMTGLKFADVKQLKVNDLDMENKTVAIRGEKYSLSEKCVSWLDMQIKSKKIPEVTPENDRLLFVNSYGRELTSQSFHTTVSKVTKRCGLPKGIAGKTIRKAYFVSELDKGVLPQELMERLRLPNVREILSAQDEYMIRNSIRQFG